MGVEDDTDHGSGDDDWTDEDSVDPYTEIVDLKMLDPPWDPKFRWARVSSRDKNWRNKGSDREFYERLIAPLVAIAVIILILSIISFYVH